MKYINVLVLTALMLMNTTNAFGYVKYPLTQGAFKIQKESDLTYGAEVTNFVNRQLISICPNNRCMHGIGFSYAHGTIEQTYEEEKYQTLTLGYGLSLATSFLLSYTSSIDLKFNVGHIDYIRHGLDKDHDYSGAEIAYKYGIPSRQSYFAGLSSGYRKNHIGNEHYISGVNIEKDQMLYSIFGGIFL